MTSEKPGKNNENKVEFCHKVSEFLLPNHYQGTALLKFIRHVSVKWKTEDLDPFEILSEAVKRGIEYIDRTGQSINTPEAWLRTTCTNILRDKVKNNCKQERYVETIAKQQQYFGNPLIEAELLEQLEKLQEALQMLPVDEMELIQLRFISGKTYQQVQSFYSSRDEERREIPLATLRKRESRALQKLRSVFFRLYQIENI